MTISVSPETQYQLNGRRAGDGPRLCSGAGHGGISMGGCDAPLESPCSGTALATGARVGSPATLVSGLGLSE